MFRMKGEPDKSSPAYLSVCQLIGTFVLFYNAHEEMMKRREPCKQ